MILRILRRHWFWLLPLLILDIILLTFYLRSCRPAASEPLPARTPVVEIPRLKSQLNNMVFPTDQTGLLDGDGDGVFQPTASGRLESALYGSVRTRKQGRSYLPAFHEGIDIAPMQLDRQGRPLDLIYAVADGQVGYVNRVGGNSNYGKYVVLVHTDPVGEVYTLYAHLADIAADIRAGNMVTAGQPLGTMGNTSSGNIPMVRAHLHFEIGLIMHDRFANWFREKKLKPDHGRFHGWNLTGIDPLAVFSAQRREPYFNLMDHINELPVAFELVLRTSRLPDFFRRHPKLWHGEAFRAPAIVVTCSEGGLPVAGRNALEHEINAGLPGVQNVAEKVLGRNGLRLVVRRSETWEIGRNGLRWIEILLYH